MFTVITAAAAAATVVVVEASSGVVVATAAARATPSPAHTLGEMWKQIYALTYVDVRAGASAVVLKSELPMCWLVMLSKKVFLFVYILNEIVATHLILYVQANIRRTHQ